MQRPGAIRRRIAAADDAGRPRPPYFLNATFLSAVRVNVSALASNA